MSEPPAPRRFVALVLVVAVLAVSAAGVLVRLAAPAHPVVIAFWRCLLVALLMAPTVLWPLVRGAGLGLGGGRLGSRDLALITGAGLLLALHFSVWFASLSTTTVLRSTVLVCLSPVWTGLLEWLVTRSRPPRFYFAGVGLAVCGAGLMAGGGEAGRSSLHGDGLALLGGLLAAAYLVVGRSVRQRVGIGPYGALLCASAALWLLPAALAFGAPLRGFPRETWLALVALALGPQLLGHIGFNYAMRTVTAATVATVILVEPVGASLLAGLAFAEWPGPREVAGSLVVLAGVVVAGRR